VKLPRLAHAKNVVLLANTSTNRPNVAVLGGFPGIGALELKRQAIRERSN
jgi:hypothetical protein